MIIQDRVYGKVDINEKVLLEIIESAPLQRIKGVACGGPDQYVFVRPVVSRFEHCIGAMIILRKLGASIEEQIAGLLHDVPHTSFSHAIDFLFKNKDHTYHEKFLDKLVRKSEIPSILSNYKLDLEYIIDENNFPLQEKNVPSLCADRIDYTLRGLCSIYNKDVNKYINDFTIFENEIVMKTKEIALEFAKDYLYMDETVWALPLNVAIHQLIADAMKIALDKKIIIEEDLFNTDNFVYEKLKKSKNESILQILKIINPNLKIKKDKNDYDFFSKTKARWIDPHFISKDNTLIRVSDEYPEFIKEIENHKKKTNDGNYIKILSY